MGDGRKISQMTVATSLTETDIFPIVQSETNKAASVPLIMNYIKTVDGTGSGFDADTLDGYHASAFATAAQGAKADLALPANSYTAQDALAKIKTVDGSGSGLDADLLDGYHASSFMLANSTTINADTLDGNHASAFAATSDFGKSLSDRGYQKLPGGLIIQWGSASAATVDGHVTMNFSINYPNSCLVVIPASQNSTTSNDDVIARLVSFNNSGCVVRAEGTGTTASNSTRNLYYIAIGY